MSASRVVARVSKDDTSAWCYPASHTSGALRLLSVDTLLRGDHSSIDIYEWSNIDWHYPTPQLPEYAAISHVWEQSEEVTEICKRVNEPLHINVGDRIHTISWYGLRQAATAAKFLHCRYFWLDFLCINQLSNEDKKIQIKNMGHIYENASSVLVMFGGVGAAASIDKYSSWINRAWTLQEATLCKQTYGLINWTMGKSFAVDGLSQANFDMLDGNMAIVPLPSLLQIRMRRPIGQGATYTRNAADGVITYDGRLSLACTVDCLGNDDEAANALGVVTFSTQPHMKYSGAWRSMWLRTSTKPQDMVFSMMHIINVSIEVDYSRTRDDLLFELVAKSQNHPAWLIIGNNLPVNPRSGLIPQWPVFDANSIPVYLIDGKSYSASSLVDGNRGYGVFDIVIRSTSNIDGHSICARLLEVKSCTPMLDTSRMVPIGRGASIRELSVSSSKHNFKARCDVHGQITSHAIVIGSTKWYSFPSTSPRVHRHTVLYFISKTSEGIWQTFGTGSFMQTMTEMSPVEKKHVQLGGSGEVPISECNCARVIALKTL